MASSEKTNADLVESSIRLHLSHKYGEQYRYSVTITRISDLAFKITRAFPPGNFKSVSFYQSLQDKFKTLVAICNHNYAKFEGAVVLGILKNYSPNFSSQELAWQDLTDKEKKSAIGEASKLTEQWPLNNPPTKPEKATFFKLKGAMNSCLSYKRAIESDRDSILDSRNGLGMYILAYLSNGLDAMTPILEIDAEGSIQYFGECTALISIAEIKTGNSGFSQLTYRLKFIAYVLGVLNPELNLIIGDGLRMTAKNVESQAENFTTKLELIDNRPIEFRLFLRSSSIQDFRA